MCWVAIFLFAFSNYDFMVILWRKSWVYLFGLNHLSSLKVIFLIFIVIATVTDTKLMVNFSSILFLALAVPNIFGLILLSGDVKSYLKEYIQKLKSGELDREVA